MGLDHENLTHSRIRGRRRKDEGKPQSMEEMRDENYPLIRLWCGDDLLFGREPMAISLARYPASRSSLMFFSMTEEAIHLPCAPDPDMAGVLSGNAED